MEQTVSAVQLDPIPPPTPVTPLPAGFIRRAVAFSIDLFVVDLLQTIYLWLALVAVDSASAQGLENLIDAGTVMSDSATHGLWLALALAYFSFFGYWGGQTPGKMLLHLRVERMDGAPLTLGQAVARSGAYLLSAVTLFGFLLAAFNLHKRALHDYIAGSHVVRT